MQTEVVIEINTAEESSETEVLQAVHVAIGEMLQRENPASLEKAIKPGGPAHLGLSARQIELVKTNAPARAQTLRDEYQSELLTIVESYQSSIALANAARGVLGEEATAAHLEKIRNGALYAGRKAIREHYRALWRAGRDAGGNLTPLSGVEVRLRQKMYLTQQGFFDNLLQDIEDNTAIMPLPQRVASYAKCSAEAFWAGLVFSDLSPDVYYLWAVGKAEHCADCVTLSRGGRWKDTMFAGIYSAGELARMGVFPGSGKLECTCNCKCVLERAERPRLAPKGGLWNRIALKGDKKSNVRTHIARRLNRHRWNFSGK